MPQSPPGTGPRSAPELCANDEQLEVEAVLAGQVIGLLTSVTATVHIRTGRLMPRHTAHVTDQLGVYVSYGSCTSQPVRARTFIDLATARLADNPAY